MPPGQLYCCQDTSRASTSSSIMGGCEISRPRQVLSAAVKPLLLMWCLLLQPGQQCDGQCLLAARFLRKRSRCCFGEEESQHHAAARSAVTLHRGIKQRRCDIRCAVLCCVLQRAYGG